MKKEHKKEQQKGKEKEKQGKTPQLKVVYFRFSPTEDNTFHAWFSGCNGILSQLVPRTYATGTKAGFDK
jgi:hypothetical protein